MQLGTVCIYNHLTFLATKSTTNRASARQPAAILAVMICVDASIKAIPQNDEPRSGRQESEIYSNNSCHYKAARTRLQITVDKRYNINSENE